jgi:hypothetical protein
MIIIWGSRSIQKNEAWVENYACPLCRSQRLLLVSVRSWFTFFFIPIFPMSSKKYYLECTLCENCFKVNDNELNQFLNTEKNKA